MPKKTTVVLDENKILKTADTDNEQLENKRSFDIREASVKDDYCNYAYEVISGVGYGDTHKVNGTGIIMDDLKDAFRALNVHLAIIDDVYKHSSREIEEIESLHNDDLTFLYSVTAFKIKGGVDNESIQLIGHKYITGVHGRMELKAPYVPLDNLSHYKWYNELKQAADRIREEVALYKEGKYIELEEEEEEIVNPQQGNIFKDVEVKDVVIENFENAKV